MTACVTTVVTKDVTAYVTRNVTGSDNCEDIALHYESDSYDIAKNPSVTTDVTGAVTDAVTANVTTFVTRKEEKNKRKKNFPLHPL